MQPSPEQARHGGTPSLATTEVVAACGRLLDEGKHEAALQDLRKLLHVQADCAPAWYLLSLCLEQQGDLEASCEAAEHALRLASHDATYCMHLGLLRCHQGRFQDGLDLLRQAVHLANHAPTFRFELYLHNAQALGHEGYDEAATLSLRKGMRFASTPDHWLRLGRAMTNRFQADLALEAYDRALEQHPEVAALHHQRGHALRELRRPYEAAQSVRRALALAPENHAALATYAELLAEAGQAKQALELVEAYPIELLDKQATHVLTALRVRLLEQGNVGVRSKGEEVAAPSDGQPAPCDRHTGNDDSHCHSSPPDAGDSVR